MSANKPCKKKVTRKSSEVKPSDRAEEIIQDRVAGLSVQAIAIKYGFDHSRVSKICSANRERIDSERAERLAERQERINAVLDADIELLVALLTETTTLLAEFVSEVSLMLQKLKAEEKLKMGFLLDGLEIATKAFDRVRAVVLAQQKQATMGE